MALEMAIDTQMPELPKNIIFCKNCVTSNQRPRIGFDKGDCKKI